MNPPGDKHHPGDPGSAGGPGGEEAAANKTSVVIVTGLSGAGKTTALHTLEDLGFFCVDNLPTVLAPRAVSVCEEGGMTRVALGMDVRVRSFITSAGEVLSELSAHGRRHVHVIFLDASDESLLHRFSESRRPHPLTTEATEEATRAGADLVGAIAVLDGVRLERERLAPMRAQATHVYDTTHLSVHDLRRSVIAHFGPAAEGAPRMLTRIISFGFKYGTPVDADLVLDVRFLENPYFVKDLKRLPGTDPRVKAFVLGLPEAQEFLKKTRELLTFMLPKYEREGKSYLTIGVGCTGGRHRSVVLAEALSEALVREGTTDTQVTQVSVVHRDVARFQDGWTKPPPAPTPSRPMLVDEDFPDSGRQSNTELKGIVSPAISPGSKGSP
ncbi:RNase adapter RapZ [Pendulispora albinea]|uniref:RNase adapter RapZ n=1 Tax=Pendulispora albinea TaxID=2741071 RepID=A0ABZ2M585_9BACT